MIPDCRDGFLQFNVDCYGVNEFYAMVGICINTQYYGFVSMFVLK